MSTFAQPSATHCTRLLIGFLLSVMSLHTPFAVASSYIQHNLVTDDQTNLTNSGYAQADHVDRNLINPWGISRSSISPFWVSNNGTDVSSLYDGTGLPRSLVVSIPGGSPTGQVFNSDNSSFKVTDGNSGPASFLFATEAGIISGWNQNVPPPGISTTATTAVDNSASGANYKGLAIDNSTLGSSMLYAANFGNGNIDTFDHNFAPTLLGLFTDPNLPIGYAPFNIQNLGGELFVTYAQKDLLNPVDEQAGAGLGIVDVFNTQGTLLRRLVTGGVLDAPWGLALAPSSGFGEFSGDLLVGNFGDGKINAFDPLTGLLDGTLSDANGNPIVIEGLWGLAFGNGANGGKTDTLYFAAGIGKEEHGLFGSLSAVPEPAALPMMILGLVLARSYMRQVASQSKSPLLVRGVAIFAKAFLGIPAQQAAKITRPLMPSAAPAVLLHSLHTQQGVCNIVIAMTRRDFGKPAFSLRKKRFVKTHALSLLGTTRLLSRSGRTQPPNSRINPVDCKDAFVNE